MFVHFHRSYLFPEQSSYHCGINDHNKWLTGIWRQGNFCLICVLLINTDCLRFVKLLRRVKDSIYSRELIKYFVKTMIHFVLPVIERKQLKRCSSSSDVLYKWILRSRRQNRVIWFYVNLSVCSVLSLKIGARSKLPSIFL